jgi:hypothetical protein
MHDSDHDNDPKILIVTNNRSVTERRGPIEFVDGSPVDVLVRVIVLLQSGYRLASTPLWPDGPAICAPYRSLILERSDEKGARYDIAGIEAVERARKVMARQRAAGGTEANEGGETSDADFALIDATHLERALRNRSLLASQTSAPCQDEKIGDSTM